MVENYKDIINFDMYFYRNTRILGEIQTYGHTHTSTIYMCAHMCKYAGQSKTHKHGYISKLKTQAQIYQRAQTQTYTHTHTHTHIVRETNTRKHE